jgi:hypothetical protein
MLSFYKGSEQERQDKFLKLVGTLRAKRIQDIWNNSYPRGCGMSKIEKEQVFKENAKAEGFTEKEIKVFLRL